MNLLRWVLMNPFGRLGIALLLALILIGCSEETPSKTPVVGASFSDKPYKIKGVWYYPQQHYEYAQEGVASWYGPKFHGRKKADCRRFNMHGISAAHRTLPIPCVVRVTNLSNNKSLKLVVDDRGPYAHTKSRIIDLSCGAAKALDVRKRGTAQVRVETLVDESRALAQNYAKKTSLDRFTKVGYKRKKQTTI